MILDDIARATAKRVEEAKRIRPLENISFEKKEKPFYFEKALKKDTLSFICEIKRASPSKGIIAEDFPYERIAEEYEEAGADAVSVLTEPEFFLGKNEYLSAVKKKTSLPILRKDFTIDPYQIYEARSIGADAVLLICALLDGEKLKRYIALADSLELSAVVEAHDEKEVKTALDSGARIIGVNNRNLKDFTVDVENSLRLRDIVPKSVTFISESGIKTRDDIKRLEDAKVDAVLIGETFMKSPDKRGMLKELRGL